MTPGVDIPHIGLDPDSDVPRFRQIHQQVLELIAAGGVKRGQALPPLRAWAADTGVAVETMAKAMRELPFMQPWLKKAFSR